MTQNNQSKEDKNLFALQDNYKKMSMTLMENGNVSGHAKLVACTLSLYYPCYPSYDVIRTHTGLARQTVKDALDELKTYNVIKWEQGHIKKQKCNIYSVQPVTEWKLPEFDFNQTKTDIGKKQQQSKTKKSLPTRLLSETESLPTRLQPSSNSNIDDLDQVRVFPEDPKEINKSKEIKKNENSDFRNIESSKKLNLIDLRTDSNLGDEVLKEIKTLVDLPKRSVQQLELLKRLRVRLEDEVINRGLEQLNVEMKLENGTKVPCTLETFYNPKILFRVRPPEAIKY